MGLTPVNWRPDGLRVFGGQSLGSNQMNDALMRRFGWHDLMTTEIEGSFDFYADLFGWAVDEPRPDGYRLLRDAGGLDFGGILPWPDNSVTRSAWTGYVLVEDADETANRVLQADGRLIMPVSEFPDGRLAPILDPDGAECVIFAPTTDNDMSPMGSGGAGSSVCWNELITHDIDIATEFYRECFGWTFDQQAIDAKGYVVARVDGRPVAGLFQPATPPLRSGWVAYFSSDDIEVSSDRAVAGGGTLAHPIKNVAGNRTDLLDPGSVWSIVRFGASCFRLA